MTFHFKCDPGSDSYSPTSRFWLFLLFFSPQILRVVRLTLGNYSRLRIRTPILTCIPRNFLNFPCEFYFEQIWVSVCLNRFALGWWWAYGVWQSGMRHGERTHGTKDRNQQSPYEKATTPLKNIFGCLEYGDAGCIQDRECAESKIHLPKAISKKTQRIKQK